MRSTFGNREIVSREIGGQFLPGRDKIVPASKFAAVCRLLWPDKTAACIATIAGKDERTAKRWLAGEYEPPIKLVLVIIEKIFERE